MAELDPDRWSPADDALVRGALATLRRDVEALDLADVRFVKARGAARRRRAVLLTGAAAAAAVLAVGYIGFGSLGSHTGSLRPAVSRTTTSTPTPSPSDSTDGAVPLPVPGELPVSDEWQRAFGITETVIIADFTESEGGAVMDCPNVGVPGRQARAQSVNSESAGLQGDQRVYTNPSSAAADRKADEVVSQLLACTPLKVSIVADSAWPKVFSAVGPASTSWFVVTHVGARVGVVTVTEPGEGGKHRWTAAQVQDIASVAQRRLGGGVQPSGSSTSPTTLARNEQMPVAGTQPLLSSSLFVAASQWASTAVSKGHSTHAVTTDFEGSATIHDCDVDTAMDGSSSAGRFGIVAVADQVDGTFLGKQRVRLTASSGAAAAEVARLSRGLTSCASRDPHVAVSTDPAHPGDFKLVRSDPGVNPVTVWVAVGAGGHTPEAVTTLYLRSPVTDGWAELDRLMALARQK